MAHPIRRVLVIHNPVAGRRKRKRLREFLRILDERGHRTRICLTKKPGDACDVARTTFDVDVIVCAGGDGTVNEVVNGLVARPERLPLPTLAFLPLGTANVLAWELDLPARKAKKMVKQIENNRVLTVRPGLANGQRFFLMASVGLDARAVAAVRPGTKRLFGGGAYVMAAVKALAQPSPSYTVTVDGKSYQAATVIVARAKHYGGPFVLTPGAGIERNSLTILMINKYGLVPAIRYGAALVKGTLSTHQDVQIAIGDAVHIDGPMADPIQMDGDIKGQLPVAITVDPRQIPSTFEFGADAPDGA